MVVQPAAEELLRISLIEVVDLAAISIIKFTQQGEHRLVGAISGCEYLFGPAKLLRVLYQKGCDSRSVAFAALVSCMIGSPDRGNCVKQRYAAICFS